MNVYQLSDIEALFDEKTATYATNKHRGGRNSAQGRDFELFHGTYRLALEAAAEFDRGELGDDVFFGDQLLGFIDDFVMQNRGQRVCCQLKSGGVSWTAGEHPVADDFRLQTALDRHLGLEATYELVVSEEAKRDDLKKVQPQDIADVEVFRFCGENTFLALDREHPELRDALDTISLDKGRRSIRQVVFSVMFAAWAESKGVVNLRAFINSLAAQPLPLFASLDPPYVLPPEAADVLDAIPNFRYSIDGNRMHYWVHGLGGWAPYPCYSEWFDRFVEFLLAHRPATIDELHPALRDEAA